MKVGDFVKYQGWKAIIAEVVPPPVPLRQAHGCQRLLFYSLYFLNEAPDFLNATDDGLCPGFQHWQLKVLSEV